MNNLITYDDFVNEKFNLKGAALGAMLGASVLTNQSCTNFHGVVNQLDNFKTIQNNDKRNVISRYGIKPPCIIDIGATYCSPCVRLKKTLDKVSEKYPNVNIVKAIFSSRDFQDDRIERLSDEVDFYNMFKLKSIPGLVIIDKNGNVYNITRDKSRNDISFKEIEFYIKKYIL